MFGRGNQGPRIRFSPVIARIVRSGLPEKLFGGGAVHFGALHVGFDPGDLALKRLDARPQLLDRHRVEVLPCKLHQRVAGLAWEEVFQVHGAGR